MGAARLYPEKWAIDPTISKAVLASDDMKRFAALNPCVTAPGLPGLKAAVAGLVDCDHVSGLCVRSIYNRWSRWNPPIGFQTSYRGWRPTGLNRVSRSSVRPIAISLLPLQAR
jgi:hypothetical protein